jgi:hypothetical protein
MIDARISDVKIAFIFQGEHRFNPIVGKSRKWYNWLAAIDPKVCVPCKNNHGQIRSKPSDWSPPYPIHPNCRCSVGYMQTILAGTATITRVSGADWRLLNSGKLPSYYISKNTATALGWNSKQGNLHLVAAGKMIGGDVFFNNKKRLPDGTGRIWYEADINYKSGYRKTHRILYSNDGLIFVTYDHYKTFFEIV